MDNDIKQWAATNTINASNDLTCHYCGTVVGREIVLHDNQIPELEKIARRIECPIAPNCKPEPPTQD